MHKPREIYTYALVVFESLFPRITRGSGDEKPKLVGDSNVTESAFKYSGNQNEFGGYYKVIPMNILDVSVNSSRGGHKFKVKLDPSYVYVELDPTSVSPELVTYFRNNAVRSIITEENASPQAEVADSLVGIEKFFLGVMEGMSKEQFEAEGINKPHKNLRRFVLPGEMFSQLVNEMDTATIFVINELSNFREDDMFKLYGGSFSRLNEFNLTDKSKMLSGIGVIPTAEFLDAANLDSFTGAISILRGFISNSSLYQYNQNVGVFTRVFGRSNFLGDQERAEAAERGLISRLSDRLQENANDQSEDSFNSIISEFSAGFGEALFKKYGASLEGSNRDVFLELRNNHSNYYASNPMARYMSWSMYETIGIAINYALSSENTQYQGIEPSNTSYYHIIKTVCFDLMMAREYPSIFAELRDGSVGSEVNTLGSLAESINKDYQTDGSNVFKEDDYLSGLYAFRDLVASIYNDIETENNQLREFYDLDNLRVITDSISSETGEKAVELASKILAGQGIENLRVPLSGHTPGLLLKGHITSISTQSALESSSYTKNITITGEGLELPLKRHTIFYDNLNPDRVLSLNIQNFGIKTSTPIGAALDIMESFAPDYVEISTSDELDVYEEAHFGKNTTIFSDRQGNFVTKGSLVYRDALDTEALPMLFTPIHYVHNGFLTFVRDIFDNVRLQEYVINQLTQGLEQNNLYAILNKVLSNSSPYIWYIDEFGFIKVRYENSSAVYTYSTIISPIIEDKDIISISTTTSESEVFTVVEVVPTALSYGVPSEGHAPGVFGRSVAPSVAEHYALYEPLPFDASNKKVVDLLKSALGRFEREVLGAAKEIYKGNDSYNAPETIKNNITEREIITYATEPENQPSPEPSVPRPRPTTNEILTFEQEGMAQRFYDTLTPDGKALVQYEGQPDLEFLDRVIKLGAKHNIYPEYIMAVMAAESWLNPAALNATTDASGLIQFVQSNLDTINRHLGTSTTLSGLRDMTRVEQMQFVEGHFDFWSKYENNGIFNELGDVYVVVFAPARAGLGGAYSGTDTLYTEEDYPDAYSGNASLDTDNNDIITKTEIAARAFSRFTYLFGSGENVGLFMSEEALSGISERAITYGSSDSQEVSGGVPAQSSTVTRTSTSLYNPSSLDYIFQTTGNVLQSEIMEAIREGVFDFSTRDRNVLLFDLDGVFEFNRVKDINGIDGDTYYAVISDAVQSALSDSDMNVALTYVGSTRFIKLLSTLSVLGVGADNLESILSNDDAQKNAVIFVLQNANIYINTKKLESFESQALVINSTKSRQLPYKGFELQDSKPEQISADLFRYGMRLYRIDDYYLTTIQFTKFRAEAIRKLHEVPLRQAEVKILGKPMVKRGNTVLVVTKEIEERKHNYINEGVLATLKDLGEERESLIFNVDDVIRDGLEPKYKYPFDRDNDEELTVTVDSVRQHFQDAHNFILGVSGSEPVSVSGYVPLHGVYGRNSTIAVKEYLAALASTAAKGHTGGYYNEERRLEKALLNVIRDVYGEDYNFKHANNIVNLLLPQTYHSYQYYVETVNHDWRFGDSFKTGLTLNYGIPAMLCVIPTQISPGVTGLDYSETHTVGWILTRSPYLLYNDRGDKFENIYIDHPLYRYTMSQQQVERDFYTKNERYTIEMILEKIRRKILYPELYGSLSEG